MLPPVVNLALEPEACYCMGRLLAPGPSILPLG